MVLESRLHSVREACNHILTTGKTHLRHAVASWFDYPHDLTCTATDAEADEQTKSEKVVAINFEELEDGPA